MPARPMRPHPNSNMVPGSVSVPVKVVEDTVLAHTMAPNRNEENRKISNFFIFVCSFICPSMVYSLAHSGFT